MLMSGGNKQIIRRRFASYGG